MKIKIHKKVQGLTIGISAIVIIIIGLVITIIYKNNTATHTPANAITAPSKVNDVQNLIMTFGTKLSQVSLLASKSQIAQEMQTNYGPYISSDLLQSWESNPLTAPGRETSNPWPARISINSVQRVGNDAYIVQGNIVEVYGADADSSQVTGIYPVTIEVTDTNGDLRITAFQIQPYIPAKKTN